MLIRTTILAQMILLVTTAGIQLPSDPNVATDHHTAQTVTTSVPNPVVDPAGIYGADETMQQQILEVMDRYADTGLPLPELRIYVHDSPEPCNGHMGLYNKGGDQHRIDLCQRYPEVITHELAHAWEYHNINDATRQAFMDRADLSAWNDKDVPHPARGVEQVARAISWGLEDQPIQSVLLNHHAEDLDRFELLTGIPSPRIAHLDTAPDSPTPAPARS